MTSSYHALHHAQTWQPSPTWNSEKDKLGVPALPMPRCQDSPVSPTGLRGKLQSFRRATSPARSKTQLPDSPKGALGLNLLYEPSEPRVDFIFVSLWLHLPTLKQLLFSNGRRADSLRYTDSMAAHGGHGVPLLTLLPSGPRNGCHTKPGSGTSASIASAMTRTGPNRSKAL
ncbi:hypothetical protein VTK26DRAFT_9459 [Humicola hyalothermophila]